MPEAVPRSSWQAGAEELTLATQLPREIDVAVIGGGVAGTIAALRLSRAGRTVLLLEREGIAAGASGRNGGFLPLGTALSYPELVTRLGREKARQIWALTLENREVVRRLIREERIVCDFREPGHLELALSDGALPVLARRQALLVADGFPAELLGPARVQALVDLPLGPRVAGGFLTPDGGLMDTARFVSGVARAAAMAGTQLARATVHAIQPDGGSLRIHTGGGVVQAAAAVVCINAWTHQLLPMLTGLVTPVRGQVLATAPLPPAFRCGMIAQVTPTEEYWQQTPAGSIVLGGCRAVRPDRDVGTDDMTPSTDVQIALDRVLPWLFPSLPKLEVTHRWAGLMAFTPDRLPILDRVPGLPGAWMLSACSGHGMSLIPRLAELVADAAMGLPLPPLAPSLGLDRPGLVVAPPTGSR
ncbi:MAG TPA: FAD-dependent oxidoreductase [Gemmatimonadales bacterium]|nr:FAD-dependent oxidoreductase [Gemmatimonadales bacterium]